MNAVRSPILRIGQLVLGVLLILGAPILAPLPGPAGIFLFAGGMVLILRNSSWARLKWARLKRRWPRAGHFVDRMMRRQSAMRRHARAKASKSAMAKAGAN
ncbi:hypothetical protein QP178_17915 [Sphingomonas aurantiaca]|uniref:hypothetical protein n=1 Tax=Sphingomonas TaxID=13687 RepID=UPI0006FA0AAC|nr:hypothetical protein [Sphingomonas sp. Leaf28]KQN07682.1 hypothetical protein ASE79_17315 [Sphingomonas sp. Leaf28]